MPDLILSREIYSPIERTYGYHAALETAFEYWPNLLDCRKIEGTYGTAVVGDRYRFRYALKGHQIEGLLDVDEAVAGERLVFHTTGGIRARFIWEYQATAHTRTRLTLRLSYAVHHSPVGPLIDRIRVEHEVTEDINAAMDRLCAVLEADAGDRPSRATPKIDGAVVLQVHTAAGELVYCPGPDGGGRCPAAVDGAPAPCRAGAVTPLHGTVVDGWRIGVPDQPFTTCPLVRVLDPAVTRA